MCGREEFQLASPGIAPHRLNDGDGSLVISLIAVR